MVALYPVVAGVATTGTATVAGGGAKAVGAGLTIRPIGGAAGGPGGPCGDVGGGDVVGGGGVSHVTCAVTVGDRPPGQSA